MPKLGLSKKDTLIVLSLVVNMLMLLVVVRMDYKDKSTFMACNVFSHREFCAAARVLPSSTDLVRQQLAFAPQE